MGVSCKRGFGQIFLCAIIHNYHAVFFTLFSLCNGIPSEDNYNIHSDFDDKVLSPLIEHTYNFIKDILISTIFTCFESFDETRSSLRV